MRYLAITCCVLAMLSACNQDRGNASAPRRSVSADPDTTETRRVKDLSEEFVILDAQDCIHQSGYCLGRDGREYRVAMYIPLSEITQYDYKYTCGKCMSMADADRIENIAIQNMEYEGPE